MHYKSFSLPKDIYIFTVVAFRIISFRLRVNLKGYNNILKSLEGTALAGGADNIFLSIYDKYYRASSFFLIRLFRDPNPCMIRSLILYDLCRRKNIGAVLKTGIRKQGNGLEGHSWVDVDGKPLNESMEYLKGFTIIHET